MLVGRVCGALHPAPAWSQAMHFLWTLELALDWWCVVYFGELKIKLMYNLSSVWETGINRGFMYALVKRGPGVLLRKMNFKNAGEAI